MSQLSNNMGGHNPSFLSLDMLVEGNLGVTWINAAPH